jgi:hypothetical protein
MCAEKKKLTFSSFCRDAAQPDEHRREYPNTPAGDRGMQLLFLDRVLRRRLQRSDAADVAK